uniref:Uncharacterized protein n=1 Tax=Odontella aurita TaxID=265563 RepID=A0A7S4M8W1_9STRA|mmetsp:Transcript_14809/g.43222  ORF Transcript_14809/g.43222 Transcript_14809/m.43222 type:complete len:265 (+) Transcript_14809:126-920(+)
MTCTSWPSFSSRRVFSAVVLMPTLIGLGCIHVGFDLLIGESLSIALQLLFCASFSSMACMATMELLLFPARWIPVLESYDKRGVDAEGHIVRRKSEANPSSKQCWQILIEYTHTVSSLQIDYVSTTNVVRRDLSVLPSTYHSKGPLPLLVFPGFPESALPKDEVLKETRMLPQDKALQSIYRAFAACVINLVVHFAIITIVVWGFRQRPYSTCTGVIAIGDAIGFYSSYLIMEWEHKTRIRNVLGLEGIKENVRRTSSCEEKEV